MRRRRSGEDAILNDDGCDGDGDCAGAVGVGGVSSRVTDECGGD
jgi:hypothetical protein